MSFSNQSQSLVKQNQINYQIASDSQLQIALLAEMQRSMSADLTCVLLPGLPTVCAASFHLVFRSE